VLNRIVMLLIKVIQIDKINAGISFITQMLNYDTEIFL